MTQKVAKVAQKFYCSKCDYSTTRQYNLLKHETTAKHLLDDAGLQKVAHSVHCCDTCNRQFKYRQGLWKHKKKCSVAPSKIEITELVPEETGISLTNTNLILQVLKQNEELIHQNQEMQKQIMEMAKEGKVVHNTVNHNKFNLNFFLNETCKDALNLKDFVASLQLQPSDLERVGELGYVDGISKIFIEGLKQLDITKRPIHCSDVKREILYIRDQDAWEKENQERKNMQWAIQHIAHKNVQQIPIWQKEHPEHKEYESSVNEKYLKIVYESMGGKHELETNYHRIIKNVAKEVIIDK